MNTWHKKIVEWLKQVDEPPDMLIVGGEHIFPAQVIAHGGNMKLLVIPDAALIHPDAAVALWDNGSARTYIPTEASSLV